MKKALIDSIFLIFLLFGISCQKQSIKIESILQNVETVIEQHPDSALILLEEITNPQSLKKSSYYWYCLLQIQAKDKSYQDITSDTLIFSIQKYYDNNNDLERAALASFYCGRILQGKKQYDKAIETYLDAEKYSEQTNNTNLKGLLQSSIGSIYYEQLIFNKAIVHYRQAENFFHSAENYKNEIIMNNSIGNCLLIQEETDSAFIYYYQALALADKYKFKHEQAGVREGLGVAYREIEDWTNAEKFIKEAWIFTKDSLEKAQLSYNLACLFEQMGKKDSAIHYIQKSLTFIADNMDNYLAANIYETWSAIEERAQNYQSALDKYKLYSDYVALIFDENRNRSVIEVENKYNYQLIENKNKQLLIERQKALLFSLLLLLVLVVFILILYQRSIQNERKLKETEQKVSQMKKLARNFNEKEKSYRNILLRHFDILKKAALLEGYLNEDEKKKGKQLLRKFNEVVYGEKNLNWNLLYETLNKLTSDFFVQLKNELPQLDELEFRICCLLAVDFNNTEIAIILNYSINTINIKRSAIRKKLGIKAFGNIRDFLNTTLKTKLPQLNRNSSQ